MVDKKTSAIAVLCVVTVLCLGLWANSAQEANRLKGGLYELEVDYEQLARVRTSLEENYSELRTEKEDLETEYSNLEADISNLEAAITSLEKSCENAQDKISILENENERLKEDLRELDLYKWLYRRAQDEREWTQIAEWYVENDTYGNIKLNTGYFYVNDNDLRVEQIFSKDIFETFIITIYRVDAQGNENDIWHREISDYTRSLPENRSELICYGFASEGYLHRIELDAKLKQQYLDAINNGSLKLHIGDYYTAPETPFIQIGKVVASIPFNP